MQVSGFFSAERDGSRDINLAGSQMGLKQFDVIKTHLEQRNLVAQVERVGKTMESALKRAGEKNSRITGVRGVGT